MPKASKQQKEKQTEQNGTNFTGLTQITINGAKEHNLKNIDLIIPRDNFVVVTGLSGSGKSSLAFDTLFAEGQRRYIECLSVYARQYLNMLKKPEVDRVEGISPAISIEQKSISHNPRSTVGTVTEIYDYLRLLYSKIGVQYCVECNIPVVQKHVDQILENIFEQYKNKRIQILAPLIRGRKGHYRELFEQLIKQGFTKVRIDGIITELTPNLQLSRYVIHNIELVVDRCTSSAQNEQRINESVELALMRGEGTMFLLIEEGSKLEEKLFSTTHSCPSCGKAYQTLSPNMFSFNSPYGACPKCGGFGEIMQFDIDKVIPNKDISIKEGAIAPIGTTKDVWFWEIIGSFAKKKKINLNTKISDYPEETFRTLMYGDGKDNENELLYTIVQGKTIMLKTRFEGILKMLLNQYNNSYSSTHKSNLEGYMSGVECPLCKGGRLKPENLAVLVNNHNIHHIVQMNIEQAYQYFSSLAKNLNERELKIANLVLKEIKSRLGFLNGVGLSYLSLDRTVRTLSGGESQRIRLASQIGSELVGIMYVLDEPSIGLHQHDNDKLIASLQKLRDLGNTVIVVEHDRSMMEQSDFLIDLGPGAGVHGGKILLADAPDNIKKLPKSVINSSLTAQYLLDEKKIEVPEKRRNGTDNYLILEGARGNNLKNVTLKIPLGKFVCITGMSGSGKSSLINDTLYPILRNHFYDTTNRILPYKSINGLELIDKVIEIDQAPIGRTPRSNPVTYTGIFTLIRDFFAMMPESKVRGYKSGRFSFNISGGRCEECEGGGIKKIVMNFMPEVYVTCDECNGKRYNKETLTVTYKGKSIADVLDMTVAEALEFFNEIPKIKKRIQTLFDVGLGYIKLGQQAPTLSGGEAQRVKLATELSKTSTGKTLYLLDEPTTGLHFEDIRILLKLLDSLVDKGNTIVIIEHSMDVIKYADWIIDLGPEGGDKGGWVVAEGTPEEIIKNKKSLTGKYLKKELK